MRKKLLSLLIIFNALGVQAGHQVGVVSNLSIRSPSGLIYFYLNGAAKTSSPICATYTYWVIYDENSSVGKEQLALILSAQAQNRPLDVTGTNTCIREGAGEDVGTIQIQ